MSGTTDALLASAISSGAIKNKNFNPAPSAAHSSKFEASADGEAVAENVAIASAHSAAQIPRITSQIPASTRRITFVVTTPDSSPITEWLCVLNAVDETEAETKLDGANVRSGNDILVLGGTVTAAASNDVLVIPRNGVFPYELSANITSVYMIPIRDGAFAGKDKSTCQVLLQGASSA